MSVPELHITSWGEWASLIAGLVLGNLLVEFVKWLLRGRP